MRASLPGAASALAVLLLAGCKLDLTGAACATNDNCPVRQYCSLPLGSKQGTCKPGARFTATLALSADPPILPAGATAQATATLSADGGPPVPDGGLVTDLVEWSVDPGSESFISVSNDAGTHGLVQALAPGQATLRGSMVFSDQQLQSTTTIVVSNAALVRIVVVADRLAYAPGTAGSAAATGFFSDGTHADLTSLVKWSSSAPSVLSVSTASGSWGQLAALAPGQATLRATYLNLTGMTSVTVGNATLATLAIFPLEARGTQGSDLALEATGQFSDGTGQPMTRSVAWSLDDPTLAFFGAPGVLTLLAQGHTTVRATAGPLQAVAPLDIAPVAPVQVEISPLWPDPLLVGSSTRLAAWATHQDGTVAPVGAGWSSTAAPLSISALGDLSADSAGLSTVVASAGSLEARASAEATADAGVSWLVWPPDAVVPVGGEGMLAIERTHADGTVQDLSTVAGWRQTDADAGTLDVDTGDRGGAVRPRLAGARLGVLAILPGRVARGTVHTPAGTPTLEVVPAAGSLPASGRTHLAAVGHWPDGTVLDVTASASWSTPANGVLVAGDGPGAGLILGADAGASTVKAGFAGTSAQASLFAEPGPGALEIWPPRATLAAGTALPLSVTLVTASGDATDVTADAVWTSSAPPVAIVGNAPGQQGQLLGQSAGDAVLTARVDLLVATLPVVVTAATLQSVQPQPPPSLVTWAPAAFGAAGRFSDGTTQDLTGWVSWSVSDPAILRIRGTGTGRGSVQPLALGAAQVSARPRGGPTAAVPVTVTGSTPVSLTVTPPGSPVALGTRPAARATVQGDDGSTVDVTGLVEWSSSDPSVATVSSVVRPGWVTTLRAGTTDLAARFAGLSDSRSLQISSDTVVKLSISAPGSLQVGAGATAIATATLSGGTTQTLGEDVVWSSDLPAILAVSNAPGARGRLLGLAPGTATLRARTRPGLPPVQTSVDLQVSAPALRSPHPGPSGE